MPDEPTCGEGLAHHAELPLLMGELIGSIADNLSAHIPGLVPSDENSQHEKHVYEHLAARLAKLGQSSMPSAPRWRGIRTCRLANTIFERCIRRGPSTP